MNWQDGVTVCLVGLLVAGTLAGLSGAAVAGDGASVPRTAPTAGQADDGGQATVATGPPIQTDDNSIDIDHEFQLTPNEPGQIDVQWTFDIPDSVPVLNVTNLPAEAHNVDLNGFVQRSGELRWNEDDQSTRTPSVTFTVSVNETTADGNLKYADTGDWALIRRPTLASVEYLYYTNQPEPTVTRTNSTAGEGVAGRAMVYLGPHETTTRTEHGQTFRLVVPEAATLRESKADIFDSVTDAADSLRVGERDERVTMFAAPTTVPWGVKGLQTGDSAFYTQANLTVDEADNTWVHEYVHTRQNFETTDATQWFTEASAEYYAALLTLKQSRIDFRAFSDSLGYGANQRYDDVTLATPSSWHDSANYEKGALVSGDLDRRIRLATDSSVSLQQVFKQLNGQRTAISQQRLLQVVENAGGQSVHDTAGQFTETTAGPEMWSQSAHNDAFTALPAQFAATFPDIGTDGFRIRGPYRNGTASGSALVPGETLHADLTVSNVGGAEGSYDISVTKDGVPVTTLTGTATSGESVTETVSFTFEQPGNYRLATGADTLDVRVRDPAIPTVTDVYANRTTVQGGGGVRVTAVISNDENRPASGVVTLQQDGQSVVDRSVKLDKNAGTRLTATARLSAVGTTTFSAGEHSVDVTVEEATTPTATPERDTGADGDGTDGDNDGTDDGETTGESGPGFGVVGTLVALAALLLVGHRVE